MFLFGQNRDSKSKGSAEHANEGKSYMDLIQVLYNHNIDELKLCRSRIEILKADSLLMHQKLNPVTTQNQRFDKMPVSTPRVDTVQSLAIRNSKFEDSLRSIHLDVIKLKDSTRRYSDYLSDLNIFYSKPFDTVLKNVTENVLIRDSIFFSKNNMSIKRINDLRVYFDAIKLLGERYDGTKVDLAINKLSNIKDSKESVDALIGKLSYYITINKSLQKTIDSISQFDFKNPIKGIADLKPKNLRSILNIITEFYWVNEYERGVYIYLDKVIKDLRNEKISDVEADVKKYLSRL